MKMRPMKLAGDNLVFGEGALDYLKTIKGKKAVIVISGGSVERNGYLDKITNNLKEANIESKVFKGVEPDPYFSTVLKGAEFMTEFNPDWIIGLGGGSAMDAAKAMWIFYEHPELKTLSDVMSPNKVPELRKKAKMISIPTTSGSASEVSRSIVITEDDTHRKCGIGDMEMMPDIALLEPGITISMPKKITAETGMDALTHAMEALVSTRANYLSDILAKQAIKDIIKFLPKAYEQADNLEYREIMQNASMVAGLAFTNVSLGIVHSIAHTLGSYYRIPHGVGDAIVLPYVIKFNKQDKRALKIYSDIEKELEIDNLEDFIFNLNENIGIPKGVKGLINNDYEYNKNIEEFSKIAIKDGCTKTNPIIPTLDEMKELVKEIYV